MAYPSNIPIESGTRTASDHRDWLLEMKYTVRWMQAFLYRTQAMSDGVFPYEYSGHDPEDTMDCVAQGTPDMTVKVKEGTAFVNAQPITKDDWNSTEMTGPTGGSAGDARRIDRVELEEDGTYSISAGTEDASPVAPTLSDDSISIALIHHRKSETSIKDTDDASNGYIVDDRTMLGGF